MVTTKICKAKKILKEHKGKLGKSRAIIGE